MVQSRSTTCRLRGAMAFGSSYSHLHVSASTRMGMAYVYVDACRAAKLVSPSATSISPTHHSPIRSCREGRHKHIHLVARKHSGPTSPVSLVELSLPVMSSPWCQVWRESLPRKGM